MQSVVVESSHRESVDFNNSEAVIIEEESPADANEDQTAITKEEEEENNTSPVNKFYVPTSKKGSNRRSSSPSLKQVMKDELESSSPGGNDISPELPKKENVVEEEEAKEEKKEGDNNQEKRVSWDVDEDGKDQVKLPNEIINEQSQQDDHQQPIFKFNYHPLPHEREYYEKLCTYAKSHNSPDTTDIVSPGAAAKLFITSGIPSDQLRMIWNMSVLPATPYPSGTVPPPAMLVDNSIQV